MHPSFVALRLFCLCLYVSKQNISCDHRKAERMADRHFSEQDSLMGGLQRQSNTNRKPRVWLRTSLTFLLGLSALAGASIGLYVWHSASMFHTSDYTHGYDLRNFLGLVAFTALSTIGFSLLYTSLRTAVAIKFPNVAGRVLLLLFALLCIGLGVAGGMLWAKQTLHCFVVFCVGTSTFAPDPSIPNANGFGWLNSTGFMSIIVGCSIGVAMLLRVLADARQSKSNDLTDVHEGDVTSDVSSRASSLYAVGYALAAVVGLAVFGVATTYVPNSWQSFLDSSIAANAVLYATPNAELCGNFYNLFTCPELPWSWMQTLNWKWSENLVLKFYPSNVIFYAYLLSLVFFGLFTRLNRRGRLFVKKNLVFGFSRGEAALVIWTAGMIGLFFAYWVHDHNYNNNWSGGPTSGLTPSEHWARATGQLAVVFLSLVFFPASRHSVMHTLFGASWEAFLWAHRILGYGVLGATFAHMVAWYRFYDINGVFPSAVFHVPLTTPIDSDNFTILLSSLAGWLLFVCMGLFALPVVRRRFFELFYHLHLIAAYFTIPIVIWHAAASWMYLLPGLTVWFADRMIRLNRSSRRVTLVSVTAIGESVTEVLFRCEGLVALPGQYVFVCIPEISLFEWHPFTLSTSEELRRENIFSLHVKVMGPATWTGSLLELAKASPHSSITLCVDGPCGVALDTSEYKRIVLCAGGIGITPCASMYSHIKRRHDISAVLLWSLREAEIAQAFVHHFSRSSVKGIGGSSVRIFFTGRGQSTYGTAALSSVEGPVLSDEVQTHGHRPVLVDEIAAAAQDCEPQDVLVFACGPESLVQDARNAAVSVGAQFHAETFLV